MSVKEDVLAALNTNSATAENVAANGRGALAKLKSLQGDEWNQEIADALGNAAVTYAETWTAFLVPPLEVEIASAEAQADQLQSLADAEKEKVDKYAQQDTVNNLKHGYAISDHGFNYNMAKKAYDKAQANANVWHEKVRTLKNQKKRIEKEIEEFILEIYGFKLMDESIAFLSHLKTARIALTQDTKQKLFGRLFLIQNVYRKSFESFEKIITDAADKYEETKFAINPDSLIYTAERKFKAKQFKGKIDISLVSKQSDSATLSYEGKNEFTIPKTKVETAKEHIEKLCKGYALSVNRSNFTLTLDKKSKDAEVPQAVDEVIATSDAYTTECTELLDAMLANGASASKIRVLLGKISNWHLDHWQKLWYKIVCIVLLVGIAVGAGFGGYAIYDNVQSQKRYERSFTQWSALSYFQTHESQTFRRFRLSSTESRYVYLKKRSEEETKSRIEYHYKQLHESQPERFEPLDGDLKAWLTEHLAGVFTEGTSPVTEIKITDEKGNIDKRNGETQRTTDIESLITVTVASDGSITDIQEVTGNGIYRHRW